MLFFFININDIKVKFIERKYLLMGECIISGGGRTVYIAGSGGGSATASAPPVLNLYNPTDYTMKALDSITLSVFVEGNNIDCTYQWFVDNELILGATEAVYNYIPNTGTENITNHYVKCAVTNKAGTTYSREAVITVYSTRWYIIKDYKIVDSSASIVNGGFGSNISISGTNISTKTTSQPYAVVNSDMFLSTNMMYRTLMGSIYETNSYYNCSYPIFASDESNFLYITKSNSTINTSVFTDMRVGIQVKSSSSGSKAYIKIKDLYIE